jgi:hypothetical protein
MIAFDDVKSTFHKLTLFFIVLTAFSVNLHARYTDISLALLFICWLSSFDYPEKWKAIWANPGGRITLFLFILIGAGALYSPENVLNGLHWWGRYHALLYTLIIISVLNNDKCRAYALHAFMASSLLVLILSYGKWLGFVPLDFALDTTDQGYVVFKYRIAQSIFLSFAVYMMLLKGMQSARWLKWTWYLLGLLGVLNICFLVNGRSGVLTLIALSILFVIEKKCLRCFIVGCILISLLGIISLSKPNLTADIKKITNVQTRVTGDMDERYEFWRNTIELSRKHLWFGNGTGSLETDYKNIPLEEKPIHPQDVSNPHNQYVLILHDLGLLGFFTLMAYWGSHFKMSFALRNSAHGDYLRGLILVMMVSSIFNCMLLAGEGKFYFILAGILLSGYKQTQQK